MVWSMLLVLGCLWRMARIQWRMESSSHMSWLRGCLLLIALFHLATGFCRDVFIKQTPGLSQCWPWA